MKSKGLWEGVKERVCLLSKGLKKESRIELLRSKEIGRIWKGERKNGRFKRIWKLLLKH